MYSRKKRSYLDEDKQLRRRDILDAAEKMLRGRGKLPALAEIAAQANIVKGTVYLYFSSKEDIYLTILRESLKSLIQTLIRDLEQKGKIKSMLDTFCGFCRENENVVYLASICSAVLENNLNKNSAISFKRELSLGLSLLAKEISKHNDYTVADSERIFLYSYLLMVAIYQQANPPNLIKTVIREERLKNLDIEFIPALKIALYQLWGIRRL